MTTIQEQIGWASQNSIFAMQDYDACRYRGHMDGADEYYQEHEAYEHLLRVLELELLHRS